MPWNDWLYITDGSEQGRRFPEAMENGFLGVDELSFSDLLAMGGDFAAQLNFYNLRHEKEGTWAGLFSHDETAVMAAILGLRLERIEGAFLHAYHHNRGHQVLLQQVIELAATIDGWYRRLVVFESGPTQGTARQLAVMIENNLAGALQEIIACSTPSISEGSGRDESLLSDFHPIWQTTASQRQPLFRFPAASEAEAGDQQVRLQLHAVFYVLLNAVSALKKKTGEVFDATLSSGAHNPAMAMFMAFLRLYSKAQGRINGFHQRHLAFYYRRLLHLEPRPCVADSTYLVFGLIPGAERTLVPAGTLFPAGKTADGRDRIYQTDGDLLVTDNRVQALRTLFFQRDNNISPEHELGYITRIYTHEIPLPDVKDISRKQAWSLFGAERAEDERPHGTPARLGFALASPVLLLREGRRKVEIAVVFTGYSTAEQTINHAIDRLCCSANEQAFFHAFGQLFGAYLLAGKDPLSPAQKRTILDQAEKTVSANAFSLLADLLQQDRQDVFYSLVQHIFLVELTGETGWHRAVGVAIKQISTKGKAILDGLQFSFTLGPEVCSIIPYNAGIHGEGYSTRLPVVRFRLNPQAHFFPCSLFDTMAVKEFQLTVQVQGLSQVQACNNHGSLDLSKPFHPFGPLPTDTSFLVFGSYEAALKPLTRMRLNITWGDLPKDREGFRSHYRGYGRDCSNESFVADLAILRDGRWFSGIDDSKGLPSLFVPLDNGEGLSAHRTLEVTRLHHCQPLQRVGSESEYGFSPQTRNGFFKLTLAGPDIAFGHKLYPTLLSETLTRNARRKLTRQHPIPQPPYTPVISQLTLDYTAHTVITAGVDARAGADDFSEKPFHLHPFGIKTIQAHTDNRFHRLLPRSADDGNLLIGLSGSRPDGALTLLFHFNDDSRRPALDTAPQIRWRYLASNRWHLLGDDRILADTTNGFLVSGIVMLDIPPDINRDNSIMPDSLYWIRVSANQGLDTFCSLVSVQAQAVQVSRFVGESDRPGRYSPLVAGTITEARQTLTGIAEIKQPLASFGGCGAEQTRQMNTRISERLRHKNRAVTPWDYERLVLERFPEVFKVKCFSALQSDHDRPQPGRIMLVVVPQQPTKNRMDFSPMLSAVVLERIRHFVLGQSSPYLAVEVRNPVYEPIQIHCSVVFTPEAQALRGHYLQQLNQAIVDYLSPWSGIGYQVRFGWEIRRTDLESYIRQLEYVAFVTRFSLLHVSGDRAGRYHLEDTARNKGGKTVSEELQPQVGVTAGIISPRFPWSLAIPLPQHSIGIIPCPQSFAPEATGIDQLQVGQTFIIDS